MKMYLQHFIFAYISMCVDFIAQLLAIIFFTLLLGTTEVHYDNSEALFLKILFGNLC